MIIAQKSTCRLKIFPDGNCRICLKEDQVESCLHSLLYRKLAHVKITLKHFGPPTVTHSYKLAGIERSEFLISQRMGP